MDLFDLDGDGDGMGVAEFGMALGLGEEMSLEERELADIARWNKENETPAVAAKKGPMAKGTGPMSLRTRRAKSKSVGEFWEYVEAGLRGEIDWDWERFNCANPLGKK